jgi:hypothetical protein
MADGRWRIPCMMVSFLHASARGANPMDTIVLLHDCLLEEHWNSLSAFPQQNQRSVYQSADHLVQLVQHSGSRLCVYKRRPNVTDMDLFDFWRDNYSVAN